MDFGSRRHKVPLWPPSRQGAYENISSTEELHLQDTPTPGTAMSANYRSLLTPKFTPSPIPHTPGLQDSAANTPAIEQLKYEEEQPRKSWFGYGWRGGAKLAFWGILMTFIVNSVIMIFVTTHYEAMEGFPVIYKGQCPQADNQNRIWHLVINVLSTGMLAASNYCMQLLCAPSRTNIDRAHSRGVWLDIGIPSLRNLRFVSWKRRWLWLALCFSSIPLHLVYNSTFYAAKATRDYNVLYVTEEFANNGTYDTNMFPSSPAINIAGIQANVSTGNDVQRLDNKRCIQEYGEQFVTEYSNVVLVVRSTPDQASSNGSLLKAIVHDLPAQKDFRKNFDSFAWICDDPETPARTGVAPGMLCSAMKDKLEVTANTWWRSGGYDIQYCLAQQIEPDCHVHFTPHLMGAVLLMNIVKCLVAFYVAFRFREEPLVTLGDAIETFIRTPDPATAGMCLATAQEMAHQFSRSTNHAPVLRATTFDSTRYRWHKNITKRQWTLLFSLFAVMFAGLITGTISGIQSLSPPTFANAAALRIGRVETQNLVYGLPQINTFGVLLTALLANAPQALLSFLYMVYNTIFTLMYIGEDWDMFGAYTATTRHRLQIASKRQTHRFLRVSNPKGSQKTTHFLSLPFRYALPLVVISGLLHWLMSQTLYLANISVIPRTGVAPRHDEITTIAFAPMGMIALMIVAGIMIVIIVLTGLRRFGGEMPIVGSNSAAISACCQVQMPERRRRELVLRKIAWGEVPTTGSQIPVDNGLKALSAGVNGLGIDATGTKRSTGVYTSEDFSDAMDRDSHSDEEYQGLRGTAEYVDVEDRPIGKSTAIAHCTFSDGFVFKPEAGKFYA